MENRDFKGIWIPKDIYLSKKLNWTDKILLLEIDSLDNEEHCFANNEYFAEFLGVSIVSISKSISKLKKLGYIEQVSFNGRERRLKSNLKADLKQTLRQDKTKLKVCLKENLNHNNINNNLINNILKRAVLKENEFLIDSRFRIKDIPQMEVYEKEVGSELLMRVQSWLIDKKQGQVVDKDFICKQIINFSKRQGLL